MAELHSDRSFAWGLGLVGSAFVVLVAAMVAALIGSTSWADVATTLARDDIQHAIMMTLLTCSLSSILAIWVAVPLAYAVSRHRFFGRTLIDAAIDIPLTLPPLVVGLGLLVLFNSPMPIGTESLDRFIHRTTGLAITYQWPAIVLAQFTLGAALSTRTMIAIFDTTPDRGERIAWTLGATRMNAFCRVVLPSVRRGILTTLLLAWARSLGEFGPVLVFAGATRMKTEVLSTSIYLELNAGRIESAVAISLLMIAMSVVIIGCVRRIGRVGVHR